jgi:hypothetical protein
LRNTVAQSRKGGDDGLGFSNPTTQPTKKAVSNKPQLQNFFISPEKSNSADSSSSGHGSDEAVEHKVLQKKLLYRKTTLLKVKMIY